MFVGFRIVIKQLYAFVPMEAHGRQFGSSVAIGGQTKAQSLILFADQLQHFRHPLRL